MNFSSHNGASLKAFSGIERLNKKFKASAYLPLESILKPLPTTITLHILELS
nr:MAG TPA: hypothetical protein [Caudoviricetes sp.]